jgi:hypothetical protein
MKTDPDSERIEVFSFNDKALKPTLSGFIAVRGAVLNRC